MKTLICSLFCIAFLVGNVAYAQKADSVKTLQDSTKGSKDTLKVPARKPDYFTKYKKPTSTDANKPQVNDTWNGKKEDKKVKSNYKYENGRVVGGETKLKLGKKKQ